jgi:cellulose synthase/poly-beta-1,6-N-acetylglucosamine synthase-like glycosyltransferase
MLKIIFWAAAALVIYTYLGYGLLVYALLKLRCQGQRPAKGASTSAREHWPAVTLLIAAYNEAAILPAKVANCQALDYPTDKLHLLFVTDGSDDGSEQLLGAYPGLQVLHQPLRQGKIAAVVRAMEVVQTPLTVFTDANTFLNAQAIMYLVQRFNQGTVGAVAGEKRVVHRAEAGASARGEGLYWRYESWLKRLDAELYSVVGAAGELWAVRTALFQTVPPDTILDDFMQTLLIAKAGYRVDYEPEAIAEERASANLREELKRKVRICAGGFQAMARLLPLLQVWRYGWLSFQYVSHRVLRWTLAPLALPFLFLSSLGLAAQGGAFYQLALLAQIAFYALAAAGWAWQHRPAPFPGFFAPLYFCLMNLSVYLGFARFVRNRQSVQWEKSRRADP